MSRRRSNSFAANVSAFAGLVSSITNPIKNKLAASNHAAYLRSRYPEQTVQRMLQERVWQGQTVQELADSLGAPAAVDRKMLATRTREIWKFYPNGVNRYRLRVTLDDNIVIGWDSKG